MIRGRFARLVALFAFLAALVAAPAPHVHAGDDDADDEEEPVAREPKCTCATKNACWHWLHAPVEPSAEPCWCPLCTNDRRHDGTKVPEGWNPQCFTGKSVDCFLRRHAASWKITCSDCLEGTKCCEYKNRARCPACAEGDAKDPLKSDCFGKDARAAAAERLAFESKWYEKSKPVVAYSRRFYVVTDLKHIQIKTQGGLRYVDAHEYAHIVLERAEKAFREFDEAFKGRVGLLRPMAIILPQRETTAFAIREQYFRNKNAPMIYSSYAGQSESAIAGGFCLNGICVSLQQAGGDDDALHQAMRHLMGNILVTCWVVRSGDNDKMPRWVFEGAAHWLGKRGKDLADEVWYCIGEERKVSGSGKGWMRDLADSAAKGRLASLDEMLVKSSLGQLTHDDHKRAWGIFEICMAEWRDPFVAMLADLRQKADVRDAFKKHFGCSTDEFNVRFVERLTGVRKTISGGREEKIEVKFDAAATDPAGEVATKIRALGTITDPALVPRVVDVMGRHESDLVRETALHALRKMKDEACRRAAWEHGLASADRFARAYAARLCRHLRLAEAKDALRKLFDDPFWMVRCEAAMALAVLKDFDSQAAMRRMVEDGNSKVRIGAMDALSMFGTEANDACIAPIGRNLAHSDWQVRLAAAQDLRVLGNWRAIDPLVARMQVESGRVGEEILRALRWISGEDLGLKPDNWKKWWEREGDHVRQRGALDPKPTKNDKANERYATSDVPKYYGVELFSQRVGFVLDVSRSTNRKFNPDASTRSLLHKKDVKDGSTIFEIARDEVAASVAALDPRAYFNVIAFGSEIRRFERGMVNASADNKKSAETFVNSYGANGETNFYGALTAALDLDTSPPVSGELRDTLDTMVFLTDGTPTVGEIVEPELLIEWYSELNRYYRVRTHTYAFGRLEVDEELLRKLAERNEGRFTQLSEEN
jgi:HEAT repeat protein